MFATGPMKLRTWITRILGALGLVLVFLLATAGSLLVHLDLPRSRRVLAHVIESQLDTTFRGSFTIGQVKRVGPYSIAVADAVVRDPQKRVALKVAELTVEVDLIEFARRLAFGGPKITLEIEHVHATRAEGHWWTQPETGKPSILDAFETRPSLTPSSGPGRDVRVAIRSIELSRGFARGAPPGLPTLELELSQVRGFVLITSAGGEVSLGRFGVVARGLGGADARGVASLRLRAPGWLWTSFDGYFGDVQVGSVVRVEGNRLMATLDLPKAAPEALRAVLPGFPLQHELRAHVELTGEPPSLMLSGRLEMGKTQAFAAGPLLLGAHPVMQLEIAGEKVDLRALLPGLPPSDFDFSSALSLTANGPNTTLDVTGVSERGLVAGVELPPTEISATFRGGLLTGHALLREPGLPVRATFALRPGGVFDLSAEAQKVQVARVTRFAKELQTRAEANLRLVAHVEKGKLTADLNAQLADFQRGDLKWSRATLSGRARGPLDDPRSLSLDGSFSGERVQAGELSFARVSGKLKGPASAPRVELSILDERGATLEAKANVAPRADGAELQGIEILVKREQSELIGRARKLDVGDDKFELSEFDLHGLGGSAKGSLEVRKERFVLVASGEKLDLSGLSRLLGLPSHYVAGRLDIDADILLARDIERGKISVSLDQGTVGPLADLSSTLHATLEDQRLQGDAETKIRGVGQASARFSLSVPGSVRDTKALKDALGELEIDVSEVDLSLLGRTLAPGRSPPIQGKLASVIKITRRVPYALPTVAITGYTDGLDVDASAFSDGAPHVSGIDARFGVNVSGESGETDLSLKLVDRHGVLASASLATAVDLVAAINNPSGLEAQLLKTPVVGKLLIDERPLNQLPVAMQLPSASGKLRAEVALTGNFSEPVLSGRVRLSSFEWLADQGSPALDLCASFGWEQVSRRIGSSGEFFLANPRRAACTGRRIAQYSLNGAVVPGASGRPARLDGGAVLSLEGLPLAAVPGLAAAGVSGRTSGRISLAQSTDIPSLSANVTLSDARVRDIPVGDGKLEVRTNDRAVGATIELARGAGRIQATAFAALDYTGAIPRLVPEEPIGIRVTAKAADAVVLSPLTSDLLNEISGQIDADLTLALLIPSAKTDNELSGKVEGSFALRQGALEFAGFGLKLHEVELAARAQSEGKETLVTIGKFAGRAGADRQAVSVRNGKLWLEGLRIARAEGSIDATELPLSFEGIPQATATTRQSIGIKIQRTPKEMQANIDVPYLIVALPQSSARNLIALDENRSIEILQPIGEPRRSSGDSLPWRFSFKLGQNVKLTRADLDLPVTGHAEVFLAERATVGGDVDLVPGGRVEVSGRTFVIESGEVHFDTGDAGDPRIRVTASWRAPDGTPVTAEVSGTLKKADLALSSPGRNSQEIYALLLGGTGSGESGGDARAAGAGVGADQLLGPLLANTPLRRVELRAGSEQTADQRTYSTYSAAVPIGDQLWFEGSYKSLTNRNGNDASTTNATNAVSGTVDWRFRRNWSLRTELGTIGTGVDLVWNYRY
jgi:hypothetical protein